MSGNGSYISQETVEQIIAAGCGECADTCLEFDGIQPDCNQCLLYGAKKAIESIPAADVRPVVRGTWVGIDDYPYEDWECDHCGTVVEGTDDPWNYYHFCPNCGADMRGGKANV